MQKKKVIYYNSNFKFVWDMDTSLCIKNLTGFFSWVMCLEVLPMSELLSFSTDLN